MSKIEAGIKASKGIGQLIKKAFGKSDDLAKGVAKTGDDLAKATGKASGALGRLIKGGAIGLGSAAAGFLGGRASQDNEDGSGGINRQGGSGRGASTGASSVIEDPIINVPALVTPLYEQQEILPLSPVAAPFKITTKDWIPVSGTVEPKEIVENYFDDDYRPVPIEASIPPEVSFFGESPRFDEIDAKLGLLERQNIFLATRLKAVEDNIEAAILQNQNTLRDNERRRDEEDIENKPRPTADKETVADLAGAALGGYLAKWVLPAMLAAAAGLSSMVAEASEGDEETIAEKLAPLDDLEENYVQLAAGYAGFKHAKGTTKIREAVTAVKTATAARAASMKTAAQGSTIVRSATRASAVVRSNVGMAANTVKDVAMRVKANPLVGKVVGGLRTLVSWIRGISQVITKPLQIAGTLLAPIAKFIGSAGKALLSKPIKWYMIIEGLLLTIQAGEAYLLSPSEEKEKEFHESVKASINNLIDLIGAVYVGAFIGTLAGGALGTVALPVIGTAGGAIVGAIAGVLLADQLFTILPIDVIVNAFYDRFILGKENAFDNLGIKMKNHVVAELNKIYDSLGNFKDTVLGGGYSMSTAEEVAEKYGAGASMIDIAYEAMRGAGTDEGALAYSLSLLRSPKEYTQFAKKYKEVIGPDLEEQIRRELSEGEYKALQDQLKKQFEDHERSVEQAAIESELSGVNNLVPTTTDIATDNALQLQSLLSESPNQETLRRLHETAEDIAKDGNLEQVKQIYSEKTDTTLNDALIDKVGREEAAILMTTMTGQTSENISYSDTNSPTNVTPIQNNNLSDEISLTAPQVQDKASQITPLIFPIPRAGNTVLPPSNPAGVSPGGSGIDTAKSHFRPSDSFLDNYGFQT
jgi:F0F1-type ATP synthase assembly protein I